MKATNAVTSGHDTSCIPDGWGIIPSLHVEGLV